MYREGVNSIIGSKKLKYQTFIRGFLINILFGKC